MADLEDVVEGNTASQTRILCQTCLKKKKKSFDSRNARDLCSPDQSRRSVHLPFCCSW
jgi:hypothetical protein